MKWLVSLFLIFSYGAAPAQQPPPGNEDFVNAISKLVTDSNFSHYYLFADAMPCSFKKYDYDEWYKYGLTEDVPIYILDELAQKSFTDNAPRNWQQEKLPAAVCIDEEKAKTLLAEENHTNKKHSGAAQNRTVYYFSRPEFTDDYQYAIIDLGFRCDDRQCGMGATFLFRQANGKWKLAGRKVAWGN